MNIINTGNLQITCQCKTIFEYDYSDVYVGDYSYSDDVLTVVRKYKCVNCPICSMTHRLYKI